MDFDPNKDYYKILGVSETADENEIKKAFRTAAVKHHPDRWWDTAKFQEMNEAYQVIWDKKKRQQYDSFRKGGFTGWFGWWGFGGGQFGGFSGGGFDFGDIDLGDLVGSMFWGWGQFWGGGFAGWGRRQQQGRDVEKHISITFEESYTWTEKKIKYTRKILEEWLEEISCEHCKGSWRVVKQINSPFGVMQTQAACEHCNGLGKQFKKNGKILESWPLVDKEEILDIKIPTGIKDNVYLKYSEKWDFWPNGNAGDLYIKILVESSNTYTRKWEDLYINVPVSIFDMVLGAEQKINHPEWKLSIKIPKGLQVKDKIKVSGKGFGKWGIFWSKWDLYLIPQLYIPKKLSKEQEKLWKELEKLK